MITQINLLNSDINSSFFYELAYLDYQFLNTTRFIINAHFYKNNKLLQGKLNYYFNQDLIKIIDNNEKCILALEREHLSPIIFFNEKIEHDISLKKSNIVSNFQKFDLEINNGQFSGKYRLFDQNNRLIKSFVLKDNLIEGPITYYDYQIQKYTTHSNYVHGKLDGLIISDDGKTKSHYKLGVKEGLETFERNPNYSDSIIYSAGKINGRLISYSFNYEGPIYKWIYNYYLDQLEGKQYCVKLGRIPDTIIVNNYKNGMLDGQNTYKFGYYDNVYESAFFKEGKKNGAYLRSLKEGNIKVVSGVYVNDTLQGRAEFYYPNGVIQAKVKYKNGKLIDTIYYYDSLAQLSRIHLLKSNLFSEEIRYHKDKVISSLKIDTINTKICYDTIKFPVYTSSFYSEYSNGIDDNFIRTHYSCDDCCDDHLSFDYLKFNEKGEVIEKGKYTNSSYTELLDYKSGKYSNLFKEGKWIYSFQKEKIYTIEYYPNAIRLASNENTDSLYFYPTQKITQYANKRKSKVLWEKYVIENTSLYNCGDKETYEINTYYIAYEKDTSMHLRNGYQKNYYPNGVLQSEGMNKAGLPTGGWKFYNDNGSLREAGNYKDGKRVGRWLAGDLSKINYLGDICMDMNDPRNVALQKELECQLDIEEAYYDYGYVISRNYVRVMK